MVITVETRYNEFNRYNEHTFGSPHVKITCNGYNELIVITYEFSGSLDQSLYLVLTVVSNSI